MEYIIPNAVFLLCLCFCFERRAHLNTAAEMLSKIRTAQEDMGEEFA
ncbi:unnamed protein product, partial [Ectocarpus sp. 12 AP-2014]